MGILQTVVLKNKIYPKESISEHMLVFTYEDGAVFCWQAPDNEIGKVSKKDRIKLSLDEELKLLDTLYTHLRGLAK